MQPKKANQILERRSHPVSQKLERRTYSVPEAAVVAGVGVMAIYKGIKAGSIPHLRNGRNIVIPKHSFHRYIDTAGCQQVPGGQDNAA